MVPKELNGYPVLHREDHRNGYYTVMIQRGEADFVVATWLKELGSTWSWGHYETSYATANEVFKGVAHRNSRRAA